MMKRIIRYLFLLIVQILFTQAFAQDFWEVITTIPDSTFSRCIDISPDGDIYLGMRGWEYPGGIYRSTDNAQTWEYLGLTERPVYGIEVCANGDIIAGVNNAIYKSIDNGETWYEVFLDGTNFKDILSLSNGYVFAGENNGTVQGNIIRSIDFGETWETNYVFSNYDEDVNAFTVAQNGDIYVGTRSMYADDGLYISEDMGESWQEIDFPGSDIYSVAIHPGGDIFVGCLGQGLYRYYQDTGEWIHEFFNVTPDDILFVGENIIFIGLNGAPISMYGIFYSDDGGQTYDWLNNGINGGDGTVINYLFRHPNKKIYAEGAGLFRSAEPVLTNLDNNSKTENIVAYNYPNPFSDYAIIKWYILKNENIVQLKIADINGNIVENRTIENSGAYRFDSYILLSGIYYYTISGNNKSYTGKMLLIK